MKYILHIFFVFILLSTLLGCSELGNNDNPMFGKTFRDAAELPEFKGYAEMRGSVIESSKDADGDYKLAFSHLQKADRHVLILEEISKPNAEGKVTFKILDTITIEHVKENQLLTYGYCNQGTNLNALLIALVLVTDSDNKYDKIEKAWLADTKTGKINQLTNTKGINCIRTESSGDEYYEEIEENEIIMDTASQLINNDTAAIYVDSLPPVE